MADVLSLLEAGTIEELRALEPASNTLPAADFTASLDFIDSLASRRSLSISRRDLATITTASSFDYLSPAVEGLRAVPSASDDAFNVSTDFRPLGDARRWQPEEFRLAPKALVRRASQVIDSQVYPRNDFPPGWRNPLDPGRSTGELDRVVRDIERRARRPSPFAFRRPNQVVICLKRKIRRQVMNAFGYAGSSGFRAPRRTYWSRVIC